MRGEAMTRICKRLEDMSIELFKMCALEFYARKGNWHTIVFAEKVKSLDVWEIEPKFEFELKRNVPNANIQIGDSYKIALDKKYQGRFDLIVLDNPQILFGIGNCYCEHFEALELVNQLLSSKGVVIFNVNRKPFDYNRHFEWQKRRKEFYGVDAGSLSTKFFLSYYKKFFHDRKMITAFSFAEDRNEGYLSYLCFGLKKDVKEISL